MAASGGVRGYKIPTRSDEHGERRWPHPMVRPLIIAAMVLLGFRACDSWVEYNEAERAEECRVYGRSWHDRGWGHAGECWDR